MKKILCLIYTILALFSLTSCMDKVADIFEKDTTTYEIGNTITDVYNMVESACVGIYATDGSVKGYSIGSGVIYKKEKNTYYVITNEHVISGCKTIKIYLGESKYYDASLIGSDKNNDLAVLAFNKDILGGKDITPIDIFSCTDIVSAGQTAIAIGCPLSLDNFNHLTVGVVTGLKENYVKTDAALNSGNSGGALFNISGRLIGINVSKTCWIYDEYGNKSSDIVVEGFGYAINMETVCKVVEDIEEKQTYVERPILGVSVSTINRYISEAVDVQYLPDTLDQGLLIKKVEFNSNAHKGGLKAYDIIYKIDDKDIKNSNDLGNFLDLAHIGDTATFYVYRRNSNSYTIKEITITFQ